MRVDYELTENDYNRIAEIVIQKKSDEVFMQAVCDISLKSAEKSFWFKFDKLNLEVGVSDLVKKYMGDLILSQITENRLLENEVRKVITEDSIRKMGAERLRQIAYSLEREAEELYDN
jgi:hypothetical protein